MTTNDGYTNSGCRNHPTQAAVLDDLCVDCAREAYEAAGIIKLVHDDTTRVQAELATLREQVDTLTAFVEGVVSINPFDDNINPRDYLVDVCKQAAALLASIDNTASE